MVGRIEELRSAWTDRERQFGLTKRAVLFKRFPGWLNERIHRGHMAFVADNLGRDTDRVLDIGCGYGRVSKGVQKRFPEARFQGVDICEEFALAYERQIGPCFCGPLQAFESDAKYDLVLVITVLTFLSSAEREAVLRDIWSFVRPGGTLCCIEPAIEHLTLWRRLTGREAAAPTGGSIAHFSRPAMERLFGELDGATIKATDSINLIPLTRATAVHHAIAVSRHE